ncbi:MAG TPA: carbamoyltransferase C-terminal domain-containing protein [Terriglobia bacterium]|jgi:carbamoyltransferase|nr:carbamoyltransferase C-terminal domain-containing protein [Terriglobia bacterium]
MLVLGISDLEHDTAAALLGAEGPIAALEEEKLSRTPASGIPQMAIDRCLAEAKVRISSLSLVGVACRPKRAWLRDEGGQWNAFAEPASGGRGVRGSQDDLFWKLEQLRMFRAVAGSAVPVVNFEHHLCHAASAFYPSDFDRALVLTLDQCGDMWSGLLAIGEGARLKALRPMRFPSSLGWFYSRVTELLGFRPGRDEHKVQWMSKEGSPGFVPVFRKLFSRGPDGIPTLNLQFVTTGPAGRAIFAPEITRELGIAEPDAAHQGRLRADIARSAQEFVEETVTELAEAWRLKTGTTNLAVAGGLFLNVMLARSLEKRTGFERVFVQPVAGNPGCALGAAYLARRRLKPDLARQALTHLYLGPRLEEEEIKAVLDNCKTIYRYLPSERQLLEETVRLLQDDKIVAWCQGRLEFGHRALGNRSIVASPFSPFVTENLNRYVKRREDFHPFGLSVPVEDAERLFDCTSNCRFMSSIGNLRSGPRELERFCFNGGAARVHIVERQVNPRFWSLLRRFGESSPAPVLVNTSFNLFGEPLVCDPRDAIRSFYCSGIDALVLGNFLVVKP